jgi:hypothetical protein
MKPNRPRRILVWLLTWIGLVFAGGRASEQEHRDQSAREPPKTAASGSPAVSRADQNKRYADLKAHQGELISASRFNNRGCGAEPYVTPKAIVIDQVRSNDTYRHGPAFSEPRTRDLYEQPEYDRLPPLVGDVDMIVLIEDYVSGDRLSHVEDGKTYFISTRHVDTKVTLLDIAKKCIVATKLFRQVPYPKGSNGDTFFESERWIKSLPRKAE